MSDKTISRKSYLTQNRGEYPDTTSFFGKSFVKVDDLRYGTNPHQTAALYKPAEGSALIGDLKTLKTGKGGLSQTNLEDISYALNICKYFDRPCCACMKHVNPSGVAVANENDHPKDVFVKAFNADERASFGCVAGFNCEVDGETAKEIMSRFIECVVAPSVTAEALKILHDHETFKKNKHIRVIECANPAGLPKFVGDQADGVPTMKVLADGSVIVADPLLSGLRSVDDLKAATGQNKKLGAVESEPKATPQQLLDILTAWYININVRSNGVVLVKNGVTLAVGTGEQDRVGAVEQAIWKYKNKFSGEENIEGAVMASDGFFPFYDAVETAANAGIRAIISPAGSIHDATVIQRANELKVALFHAPERIFSHH